MAVIEVTAGLIVGSDIRIESSGIICRDEFPWTLQPSPTGNNKGTTPPEYPLKSRFRTEEEAKRINEIQLVFLSWAQEVGGSNPPAPTKQQKAVGSDQLSVFRAQLSVEDPSRRMPSIHDTV